ncbi:hypothetical protein L9F63_018083, partial [Diploptera punctata]
QTYSQINKICTSFPKMVKLQHMKRRSQVTRQMPVKMDILGLLAEVVKKETNGIIQIIILSFDVIIKMLSDGHAYQALVLERPKACST